MNKSKINFMKLSGQIMKHSWKASSLTFLALVTTTLLIGILQIAEIYGLQYLFDGVVDYSKGIISLNQIIPSFIFLAFILVLNPMVNTVADLAQGYFWRRGNGYFQALYHEKVSEIDLIDFELAATFDEMKKATLANEDAPAVSRTVIQLFVYYIPFCIYVSIYLISVKPILAVVLALIFLSTLLSELLRASALFQLEDKTAGSKRERDHYEECIISTRFFKETRTLGAFSFFFQRFMEATRNLNDAVYRMERRASRNDMILGIINIAGYLGVLGLLLYYLFDRSVTVGVFATVFYSMERMNGVLQQLIQNVGSLATSISTSSFLLDFLDQKNPKRNMDYLDKKQNIHVENISFAYPGVGGKIIDGINFDIESGETVAIVGANGAGKTTLTKLLTGLYQPTSGRILYGDQDIKGYSKESLFHDVSGIFQNYQRYKLSVGENVKISDADSDKDIVEALSEAGVSLHKFTNDIDTVLSRDFEGIDLSGGEWQRIAIARGIYRGHNIIVLDEPTSAIDPIEEVNLFSMFQRIAKGNTAILVTHRLGSVKVADKILVLDKGTVSEFGSHDELMEKKGYYYTMYQEQAQWYQR